MKKTNEEYFSIDPMSLVKGRPLTFDVLIYLQLNERVIIFKRKGSSIEDMNDLLRLRDRGLKHLFIRESDRDAYNEYMKGVEEQQDSAASGATSAPPSIAPEEPPQTAEAGSIIPEFSPEQNAAAAKTIAEQLEAAAPAPPNTPEAKQPFEPPKAAEQLMAALLQPEPECRKAQDDAKQMIKDILKRTGTPSTISEIIDNPDTEHATSVAIYTTLFAMGLKRNDQQLLQDLIVASLLHDIGMTQIDPEILVVPQKQLTEKQRYAYETHVLLGMTMLGDLDYTPNKRVISMFHQHHEKFNGSGYPQHLESFRIEELAQLIGIADLLDSIVRGRYDGVARSLADSLVLVGQIEKTSTFPEYFNPDTFRKVMNWLKKGGGQDFLAMAETAVNETKNKMLKAS